MKICAVICEFNPFHNGHKYLLSEAKRVSGCDAILNVMSGNFVQRAEAAIINKTLRAEFALLNGADMVVELPVLYSTASGEQFAKGAINIITQIPNVTSVCFGAENSDIENLKILADIQLTENSEFKNMIKELLSSGISYPSALAKTTSKIAKKYNIMSDILLNKPNNLLAIEYIKQLMLQKNNIELYAVKRIGSGYNDKTLAENYSSATSIRENVINDNFETALKNMPENCRDKFKTEISNHLPSKEIFDALVIDSIRNNNNLANLYDSGEGLEIKLQKNAFDYFDLETIIQKTKSKRYPMSRIKRLCIQSLLQINKESLSGSSPVPIKVLGIKNDFKSFLALLPENRIIQNIDYDKECVKEFPYYMEVEKKANNVYSLITKKPGNTFYSNKLITV